MCSPGRLLIFDSNTAVMFILSALISSHCSSILTEGIEIKLFYFISLSFYCLITHNEQVSVHLDLNDSAAVT